MNIQSINLGKFTQETKELGMNSYLEQIVSEKDKSVFENEEIQIKLEKHNDDLIIVQSNNKLLDNTIGTTLIETKDMKKALKIIRIYNWIT